MRLSDAFRESARIEELAADLYGRFAEDSAKDFEVAQFWRRMSQAEQLHAASLRGAAARLESRHQSTTVDLRSIAAIRGFMSAMTSDVGAKSLDQAFRVALEIESLELDRMYRELLGRESAELSDLGEVFDANATEVGDHEESLLLMIEARSRDPGLVADARRRRAGHRGATSTPLGMMLHRVFDGVRGRSRRENR